MSISELKANLSRYVRRVRRGGEVQIVHRGVPVARLVGIDRPSRAQDAARRERLIESGVLRAGTANAAAILDEPPIGLPGAELTAALGEEREDRL
ncbi:MAG: type II toxin-antitoxin system prevent-host-death family antitoxin [Deltaproteobacteria bacterium]|nr:type II toxin-antitoxin system prevent-host-death family antitoxin [Deltaproteobacteria bacterium]MBW2533352.1 type II toxin-antitoxin system prevent-host-death family antitoxin [Deltaproteobacteria bacterium]